MNRQIALRRAATRDIAEIARFISETKSRASGSRWRLRIEKAIIALATEADMWPEADEAEELGRPLRFRLFDKGHKAYRILFTLDGATVNVVRVVHASQDWLTMDDF